MTDRPIPPEASGAEPTPELLAPEARRPWTILGRLSQSVREQNWFAVVLELAIVVLGVVIGFQVTAWGQSQADRVKERAYLHQLVEDLRETEQNIAALNAWLLRFEESSGALQRSFYEPTRPHPDTLLALISGSLGYGTPSAITGAAEALVSTGDLGLIQNDSLRLAITGYLQEVRAVAEQQSSLKADLATSVRVLRAGRSLSGDWDRYLDISAQLSYPILPSDPLYPVPPGPRRSSPPLDPEAFLADRDMEAAVFDIVDIRLDARWGRERLLDATVALREQVDAEITP